MGKILLVGQAPSATAQRLAGQGVPEPFSGDGPSVRLLASLLGIRTGELTDVFECRNLLPRHPGPQRGKGDRFDAAAGRLAALLLLLGCTGPRGMVLAGRHVARAFGLQRHPALSVVRLTCDRSALLLPHPSGVNLWWNSAANKRRAGRVLRRFVKET